MSKLKVWLSERYANVKQGAFPATSIQNDWMEELLSERDELRAKLDCAREALEVALPALLDDAYIMAAEALAKIIADDYKHSSQTPNMPDTFAFKEALRSILGHHSHSPRCDLSEGAGLMGCELTTVEQIALKALYPVPTEKVCEHVGGKSTNGNVCGTSSERP